MKLILIVFSVIFIIATSCNSDNKFDCLKSTGKIITEKRELSKFTNVEINDHFIVNLTQDTIDYIIIETGDNLLSEIEVKTENNTLKINDNLTCNWVRSYKNQKILNIHFTSLDSLIINGECDIVSTDTLSFDTLFVFINSGVATTNLKIKANGIYFRSIATGDFILSGEVKFNYQYIFGTGYLHAQNLKSQYTHIVAKTTGDCYINVSNHLFVEQIYSGNVYYYGNPNKVELKSIVFKDKLFAL